MTNRRAGQILLLVVLALSVARFSTSVTFTVINTNDSGPGSLRQAILGANANSGLDTIVFSIGSGPQTIAPLSALPTITDPVVIDGTTQPGYAGTPWSGDRSQHRCIGGEGRLDRISGRR